MALFSFDFESGSISVFESLLEFYGLGKDRQ